MQATWKKCGLVAAFLGWDAWNVSAFLWSLRSPPLKVIGSVELHPSFFLLVACVAIPTTVAISIALFWGQISKRIPSNRFHGLYGEVRELTDKFIWSIDTETKTVVFDAELRERMLALKYKLIRLRVNTPSLEVINDRDWYRWLPQLAAWTDTRNLSEARRYKP